MNYLFGQIKLGLRLLVLGVCMQILAPGLCSGQSYSFLNRREKDKIRFSLVKNLIIIPIYLNNKGPYNFVLDTGVSLLLVTEPSLADSLSLASKRTIKVTGYGGADEMEAMVSTDLSVSIGKLRLWDVPAAVLKSDILDLSSYLGVKVYGLIGYPFFKDLVVQINYSSKMLYFQPGYMGVKRPGEAIPLELVDNKPFVKAKVSYGRGDFDVKLILDNGASHAVSFESYQSGPFPLPEKTIPANLGVGLGGKITGNIGRMPLVEIGSFCLKNVLSSFPSYEDVGSKSQNKDRHGNLGSDLLRHFNVTLDYSNSVMYLKKNPFYKDAFEHDMSGMEIYHDEEHAKGYFISRIEPGSPAEKAGFLPGDQLTMIDLKSVYNYSLDEISSLLKSKDGRHFIFEVFRKGKYLLKVFKLEKRI